MSGCKKKGMVLKIQQKKNVEVHVFSVTKYFDMKGATYGETVNSSSGHNVGI